METLNEFKLFSAENLLRALKFIQFLATVVLLSFWEKYLNSVNLIKNKDKAL